MIQNFKNVLKGSSYRQQSPTSSDSQFSPTFTDYVISFLLNGNVNVILIFFISTIFIVYSRNECDSMAYYCDFNCFVSFQLMFCSNSIIANFTCTLNVNEKNLICQSTPCFWESECKSFCFYMLSFSLGKCNIGVFVEGHTAPKRE